MTQQELHEIQGGRIQSPTPQEEEPFATAQVGDWLGSRCAERRLEVMAGHKLGALAAKTGNTILGFTNMLVAHYWGKGLFPSTQPFLDTI